MISKPIILPDCLRLLISPVSCALCGSEAKWQRNDHPVCSVCYLFKLTSIGTSPEFAELVQLMPDSTRSLPDRARADHALSILVLTNRMFQLKDAEHAE